jgi:Flp pilus assembly protein CpaB
MWNKVAILIALVLGVLAVIMVKKYIQSEHDKLYADMILVCVAKSDILEGEAITTDHIGFQRMPFRYKPKPAYFWKDREQILGLTVKQKISAQEHFLDSMFETSEGAKTKVNIVNVPISYRALAIKMSGTEGVAGLCTPGDHIDIVATLSTEEIDPDDILAEPKTVKYTMTVLPNVTIAALDKFTGKTGEKPPDNYAAATFYLTPLECEVLVHLQKGTQKAEFTYLLRNPNEVYEPEAGDPRRVTDDRLEQQIKEMIRFHGQVGD